METASTTVLTKKKERNEKLFFVAKRGRSTTSRKPKYSTNAGCNIYREHTKRKNNKCDDNNDRVHGDGEEENPSVTTTLVLADRFALFGDSNLALACSIFLLAIAVSINLFLEGDNNTEDVSGILTSPFSNPYSSLLPRTDSHEEYNNRCVSPPVSFAALSKPGDLDELFERIVAMGTNNTHRNETMFKNEYSVIVHSRPEDTHYGIRYGSNRDNNTYDVAASSSLSPWVITLENFLTDDECDTMIQHGHEERFRPSIHAVTSGGKGQNNHNRTPTSTIKRTTVTSTMIEDKEKQSIHEKTVGRRTSETAWCTSRNSCIDKDIQRLHRRISQILGIPSKNSEGFQILKYDLGQFYSTHHDYIPHQRTRQCGPRILTVLIYLSDADGGDTAFSDLKPQLKIQPRKGRTLIFPNVLNSDPMKSDIRMRHQALPVENGTKYATNIWYHMYAYDLAVANGCN